ncbi:Uncharacterised protein [Legionella feeleii]|uniref:Uncharacterized protein n=1 Tax=Legionella feeleii TaxID=453 RepID=A0A2X1QPI2_9GAMM|nr:Uncharacterised protein [Legionella feeleii]
MLVTLFFKQETIVSSKETSAPQQLKPIAALSLKQNKAANCQGSIAFFNKEPQAFIKKFKQV